MVEHGINISLSTSKRKFYIDRRKKASFFLRKDFLFLSFSNIMLHSCSFSVETNTFKNFIGLSFVISSKSVTLFGALLLTAFIPSVKRSAECLLKRFFLYRFQGCWCETPFSFLVKMKRSFIIEKTIKIYY